MREIRQSGSEGGGGETNRLSLPLFGTGVRQPRCRLSMNDPPTALVGFGTGARQPSQDIG
jgi:hypothetical protein